MTHRPSSWRDDIAPLAMAAVGALFLLGSLLVMLTTSTHYEDPSPAGPRLEVTATVPVPRPVVGEVCFPVGANGVTDTGPAVCRELEPGQRRWVLSP